MNRLAFLASLVGLGGLVAKAQKSGIITLQRSADPLPTATGGSGGTLTFSALSSAPALIDFSPERVLISIEERLLGWFSNGKPTSNQCPLCGTMAEQVEACSPPASVQSDSHWCAPREAIVRRKRCNNAFFQDTE